MLRRVLEFWYLPASIVLMYRGGIVQTVTQLDDQTGDDTLRHYFFGNEIEGLWGFAASFASILLTLSLFLYSWHKLSRLDPVRSLSERAAHSVERYSLGFLFRNPFLDSQRSIDYFVAALFLIAIGSVSILILDLILDAKPVHSAR